MLHMRHAVRTDHHRSPPFPHLVVAEIGGEMYGFPVCSAWCAYKLGHRTAPFHRMKNTN